MTNTTSGGATVELYRPSNGTEGEMFESEFCEHCERDRAWREAWQTDGDPGNVKGCDILARALAFGIDDPQYPREWVRIAMVDPVDGLPINWGKCTAFEPPENWKP